VLKSRAEKLLLIAYTRHETLLPLSIGDLAVGALYMIGSKVSQME